SKLPDHSVLLCDFEIKETRSMYTDKTDHLIGDEKQGNKMKYRKFNLKQIPDNFLKNDNTQNSLNEAILRIENESANQATIDDTYDKVCEIYYDEMLNMLPSHDISKNTKRKSRFKPKPWWDSNLNELFKKLC
ncbi:unnamed protein product, partial [Owenia fusiformis]